jgi:filamentous hemagglutinin family protein
MNHIYRILWNTALGACVAVAENAKGAGKAGTARSRVAVDGPRMAGFTLKPACRAALVLLAAVALLSPHAHAANASDATVSLGSGTVSTSGATTTINQASQRLAIDWTQLSTAANEALQFNQPNAQAIALNRIIGSSPSTFLGSLTANGQVFILNPNGVLFGAGSQVNVGGLVASTLSMSNADFMAGNHGFSNNGASGSVVNQGTLNAAPGGYLALLAPEVRNEGVMTASLGTALLAAGNKVTLNLDNGSLLGYSIDQGAINALAENKHLIQADGGQVLLSAKAMDALTTATVNNTGVIEARTLQNKAGRILLMGDMETGTVNVAGTLDASAPNGGDGGFVETSAAHVKVAAGTRVTTRAATGQTGTWLIDPADYNIAASGGDISGATLSANLVNTSVSILSSSGAQTAGNGDINVNDTVNWSANTLTLTAARDINFNAVATATGTAGLVMNTSTANGADTAVAGGRVNMALGAGGFTGRVDMATGTSLSINGEAYTIVNSLGAEGVLSANDLQGMYGNANARFVLGSDIDASATSTWNGGAGFVGMPNYQGRFNGLGHTITGLTINAPTADEIGLFGRLQSNGNARVANVGLVGGSFTGRNYVGALVGIAFGSSNAVISNSYSTAAVNGSNYIGGLVGSLSQGSIVNSYATGAVTGTATNNQIIGGLVGLASHFAGGSPLITSSYATGTVTAGGASSMAGDLVGNSGHGIITGSYATGDVHGAGNDTEVGGLIGRVTDTVINTSYATGAVRGSSGNGSNNGAAGGLVGMLRQGSVTSSHASGTVAPTGAGTTGPFRIGGLVGAATYFSSDIASIINSYATGAVSGPFFVGGLVGGTGNGSTTINGSYASGTVSAGMFRGGLVGGTSTGAVTISNSYATGNVSGTGGYGGGLIGLAEYAGTTISNSYASNVVSGSGTRGGFAGLISNATLTNNFWNSDTATTAFGVGSTANNAGATSLTGAQFKQSATFTGAGWNASNVGGDGTIWRIYEGNTGPLLRSFLTAYNLTPTFDGSASSPANIGAYSEAGADLTKLLGTAAATDTLTLRSSGAADSYSATSSATGRYSHQQGYDLTATGTIATPGSAAGDVRLDNDISYTSGTLAMGATGNIDLNGKAISASSGTLQINSGTAIHAGAVNVDVFNMAGGTWQQVGSTPAAFVARDFGISGGTFVRALAGDGLSTGTAYQIADVYGLQGAGSAGMLNKNYILANNIDASGTANWNGGAGFKPIGDSPAGYSGTFDGDHKTISDLTINRPAQNGAGLFGQLGYGGKIKNVGLTNVSVSGAYSVGSLAGHSEGAISNSYSTGSVSGNQAVGGLVGENSSLGSIVGSYSTANVSGPAWVGGLVGNSDGAIYDSYATGAVTGSNGFTTVGGLIGLLRYNGFVSSSYSSGSVSGGSGFIGGLIGQQLAGASSVNNSFWDTDTSGQAASAGGTGKTTAEMQQAATFTGAGWNASNVGGDGTTWRIYEGQTGPLLRSFLTPLNMDLAYDGSGAALANIGAYSTPGAADTSKLFGTAAAPGALTLASSGVAGNYLASAPVSGLYSQQDGYDILPTASRSISTPGSAVGDVRLDNGVTWTNGTLAMGAANNIDLNSKAITSTSGTLQINSGTAINAGTVNVDVLNMAGGIWQQVGSTPAAFAARDFRISGGTFIRALGGDGTSGDAYQLTDVYGLQGVGSAGMLDKNYKLANNIDASGTSGWNSGAGFKPIGDGDDLAPSGIFPHAFTGSVDGQGHSVNNLTINLPSTDQVALFGNVGASGVIHDIGVKGGSITGLNFTGALVGYNSGTINKAYASADVHGNFYVGGLVGVNDNGATIRQSYATGNVTGNQYWVGGLVGVNYVGNVIDSYAQ